MSQALSFLPSVLLISFSFDANAEKFLFVWLKRSLTSWSTSFCFEFQIKLINDGSVMKKFGVAWIKKIAKQIKSLLEEVEFANMKNNLDAMKWLKILIKKINFWLILKSDFVVLTLLSTRNDPNCSSHI